MLSSTAKEGKRLMKKFLTITYASYKISLNYPSILVFGCLIKGLITRYQLSSYL